MRRVLLRSKQRAYACIPAYTTVSILDAISNLRDKFFSEHLQSRNFSDQSRMDGFVPLPASTK